MYIGYICPPLASTGQAAEKQSTGRFIRTNAVSQSVCTKKTAQQPTQRRASTPIPNNNNANHNHTSSNSGAKPSSVSSSNFLAGGTKNQSHTINKNLPISQATRPSAICRHQHAADIVHRRRPSTGLLCLCLSSSPSSASSASSAAAAALRPSLLPRRRRVAVPRPLPPPVADRVLRRPPHRPDGQEPLGGEQGRRRRWAGGD